MPKNASVHSLGNTKANVSENAEDKQKLLDESQGPTENQRPSSKVKVKSVGKETKGKPDMDRDFFQGDKHDDNNEDKDKRVSQGTTAENSINNGKKRTSLELFFKEMKLEPELGPLLKTTDIKIHAVEYIYKGGYNNQSHTYHLFNSHNRRIFFVNEEYKYCRICCFRNNRPFVLDFFGFDGGKRSSLFKIRREYNCLTCFFGTRCYGSQVVVSCESGQQDKVHYMVGLVKQNFNCSKPTYAVFDGNGTEILTIISPTCSPTYGSCTESQNRFHVFFIDDGMTENGGAQIAKIFVDVEIEQVIDEEDLHVLTGQLINHTLDIRFRKNLDTHLKALILSAALLIDFNHYSPGYCEPTPGYVVVVLLTILLLIIALFLLTVVKLKL